MSNVGFSPVGSASMQSNLYQFQEDKTYFTMLTYGYLNDLLILCPLILYHLIICCAPGGNFEKRWVYFLPIICIDPFIGKEGYYILLGSL